jgi:hypothetical protein
MVFLISTLEKYFSFLDKIEPNTLFYTLIIFTWIISLWEHYLSYRQVDFLLFFFDNQNFYIYLNFIL